jgi:hypothetical protein
VSSARSYGVRALAVLLAALAALWVPAYAAAADEVAFTIEDRRIAESSGLATDTERELYWTINDSGSAGVAYAIDADGRTDGTVRFLADPVDIEAIALDDNRLLLADIGDNRARREYVTVFAIDNPQPNDDTRTYRAYDFAYPDGPHDAEAMLVDPRGRLYFVTKGVRAGIYRAPPNPSRQGVNRLTKVGDAPAFVTDGTFLPDGDRIALRTYVSVVTLDAQTYEVLAQAPLPLQPQGESITMDLDGRFLLIGSEGVLSKVYRVPVPTTVGPVPTPSASPPSSPSRTPTPSASGAAEEEPAVLTTDDGGTWLAVGLAAAVALLAAGLVIVIRKP